MKRPITSHAGVQDQPNGPITAFGEEEARVVHSQSKRCTTGQTILFPASGFGWFGFVLGYSSMSKLLESMRPKAMKEANAYVQTLLKSLYRHTYLPTYLPTYREITKNHIFVTQVKFISVLFQYLVLLCFFYIYIYLYTDYF